MKLFFSSFPSLIFLHYVRCSTFNVYSVEYTTSALSEFSVFRRATWVSFQKERLVASPFLAERRENRALGRILLMTSIVTGKWKSGNKFSAARTTEKQQKRNAR